MKTKWIAILGGVYVVMFLILAHIFTPLNYPKLKDASLTAVFWSSGIFGTFFDALTGTKSVWMPHPLGILASLLFSVFIYAIPVYLLLKVCCKNQHLR